MEETTTAEKNYKLDFYGKGGEFFGIIIVNWLLTMITLGFYYPWAKAKQLNFLYGSTSLNNDRFSFHGNGKEMFIGFIKAILVFAIIYGLSIMFIYMQMPITGILLLYAGILGIIPLAIHGSYRYRMSRTSWRGIRFGYRGNRNEFMVSFYKWILFTLVTLGIYGAWLSINVRRYVMSNVKMGDVSFKYEANGGDYFWLNFKSYFLSIITLGIYSFWWYSDLLAFYVNNLSLEKGEEKITLKSTATGGDFFGLLIVNLLIIVFTLGLGYAWVVTRTMKFLTDHIQMEGNIDLDTINQTEEDFNDATGEDIGDFLNLDFAL
jgi:uncharacterized membrane protein YjgN (DUF898 family)